MVQVWVCRSGAGSELGAGRGRMSAEIVWMIECRKDNAGVSCTAFFAMFLKNSSLVDCRETNF